MGRGDATFGGRTRLIILCVHAAEAREGRGPGS